MWAVLSGEHNFPNIGWVYSLASFQRIVTIETTMGLRINLQHASWLAHILKRSGSVPKLRDEWEGAQREVLNQFLHQIENDFYSGMGYERRWREGIAALARSVSESSHDQGRIFSEG